MRTIIQILCVFLLLCQHAYADSNVEAGKKKAIPCFACHGPTGNTNVSEWPKLASQQETYLAKQLIDFHQGKDSGRYNETMTPNAVNLTDEDIHDLAAYFASLKGDVGATQPKYIELGELLYRGGDSSRKIPACMACHGPAGSGLSSAIFPRLAGQNIQYTILQLKAFRSGERHNDLNSMMRISAQNLTDDDITALANYINGLHQ